ncbi:MAG: Ara7-Gdpnh2ATVPS9A [Monoraphidium minutum]|nr:MAG: Ara7-Gdpnh2ATVPS9A [Monoraphidium minutum]
MDDGAATTPLAFSRFLEIMNSDQAKDLVRRINTFMKDLRQRVPMADADSEMVQSFLEEMETAMAKHPLFAGSGPAELDAATEALEKYLMTKLHDRTFGMATEDTERDALLAVRCEALQFVQPHHLEIGEGVAGGDALDQAAHELNRINNYKAPRDKLVCILNCCRVIGNMLHSGPGAAGGVAGADDFTPVLILALIRARPPRLASNIAYVERYRMRSRMAGEAAYYFVQLRGDVC